MEGRIAACRIPDIPAGAARRSRAIRRSIDILIPGIAVAIGFERRAWDRIERCHVKAGSGENTSKIVSWHRELPPLDAEVVADHTVEATSGRVPGTIAHRDELWDQCYRELMASAEHRLTQEVARLGGHFAHVHDEAIDPRHDDAAREAWLHGRFSYTLYRRPPTVR
jgi:hypothetical protein